MNWIKNLTDTEEGRMILEQERILLETTESIVALMEKHKVSVEQLAARINKTPAFVKKILQGKGITLEILSKILFVLGYSFGLTIKEK